MASPQGRTTKKITGWTLFWGLQDSPYLHSEVEHQTVRMGFSQLIKQISPCGVRDHLLKPRWGLPETKGKAKGFSLV